MEAGSQIRDYKKRTLGVLIITKHSWPAGSHSNVYLTALNSLCFACSNLCAFALIAQGEIITVYERLSIIPQLERKNILNQEKSGCSVDFVRNPSLVMQHSIKTQLSSRVLQKQGVKIPWILKYILNCYEFTTAF